ncbi:MAG: tyrosine-type recombinase/integrase [Vicinamibacteria bacterium]
MNAWESHLHTFLEELELHRFSASSRQHAGRVLPTLFSHLREEGVHDLGAVTEEHLLGFARYLKDRRTPKGKPLSTWTQSTYLSAVRSFFAYLDRRNVILKNPAQRLRLPRAQRLPRKALTESQVRRLLGTPSSSSMIGQRDRAVLELLYGTAIRRSECVRLNVFDVDLREPSLWVRDGKGRKDRLVPIPSQTAEVVGVYLEQVRPHLVHDPKEKAFFLTRWGKRMSPSLLEVMVRGHAVSAAIEQRVYPHALRHACATHLLQRGADIRHIQELLGHSQIRTTAIYTEVRVDDLKAVLSKAHPRERLWKKKKRPGH